MLGQARRRPRHCRAACAARSASPRCGDSRTRLPMRCSPSGKGLSEPSITRSVPITSVSSRSAPVSNTARVDVEAPRIATTAACGQSWRTMSRCRQALSTRPSSQAKLPPPWAKQIFSVSGMRSSAPDRISDSMPSWVSAGIATSQGSIHFFMRPPPIMSQGCTSTGMRLLGAVDQELHQRLVVQVALADVVADLHADAAGIHRPAGLAAGQVQRPAAAPGPAPSAASARRRSSRARVRSCAPPSRRRAAAGQA